ncbi:MAG: ATP-binding protein [Phycisphaerales bacterium]
MITLEQIDRWRTAAREHAHLEFKEAKNGFGIDKLFEYCVAIANEGGGHLVLGVADRHPRPVVGLSAFDNLEKATRQVHDKVGFHIEMEAVEHPQGRVVVVLVPGRPKGTAYELDGRYLMRSGESLVSMSEDRLRAIFDEGKPDWLEESTRSGMTAQEVIDSLDTQSFFELLEEPFPTTSHAILERLIRERLVIPRHDRFDLLRLGGLTLARRLADFPELRRKAPRVIVYNGASKVSTRLDQIGNDGYAVGFRNLVRLVMSQLSQNEVVQDATRLQMKLVPESAVREVVANALIHQDFLIGGTSVMIEVYSDRVEVSNPGTPIVEVNRFIDGYQSRNERLADLMRRMRVCEEKGSGIDKVVHAAEVFQLPAPQFREEHRRTSVVLAGPKQFEDMDRDDRIRACYQHAGLRRVANDFMTNQTLRERFKLPDAKSATVSQVIAATLEAGLIKADSSVGTSLRLRRYLPYWA